MTPKQRAAQAALEYVKSGMAVGLGTGSTADFFLQALGHALHEGRLADIRGIATSTQSERRAQELGISLINLGDVPLLDLTVDGADEVAPNLDLIKGLGGALLREKIVAQNSRVLIIIADASKRVDQLATHAPLPVEVTPFGYKVHEQFLRTLGGEPILRMAHGMVFTTDNGNYIFDCHFPHGIADPASLQNELSSRAGIVETGLFLGLAKIALIGDDHHVQTLQPT